MSNSAVQIVINWPTGKYQLFIFNFLKNASAVHTYIGETMQYSFTYLHLRENISCTAHTACTQPRKQQLKKCTSQRKYFQLCICTYKIKHQLYDVYINTNLRKQQLYICMYRLKTTSAVSTCILEKALAICR